MSRKYRKYVIYAPSGRKLVVVRARKLKSVKFPKPAPMGFDPARFK